MAQFEILLPAMGEGIIEATLISWLKNEGDTVNIDDNLIEVATDKVNSEVPSTANGILLKKLYAENDVISVGQPFAIVGTEIESEAPAPNDHNNLEATPIIEDPILGKGIAENNMVHKIQTNINSSTEKIETTKNQNKDSFGFLSPLVQNIIKQENLSNQDLEEIAGTGKDGRITKDDILAYLAQRSSSPIASSKISTHEIISNSSATPNERVQITPSQKAEVKATPISNENGGVPMNRMRKLIADHMVKSIQTSAHVCSFIEADVTNMVQWRNENKNRFESKYGEKLTFTPLLIEAIAAAIREFPILNSSTDGSNIFYKKDINIGMATALPDGNLIVPVIKNADMLNLMGLAKLVNDLGNRAKANKLKPDEIQGGTYTMTNLGSFGNLFGTPIINQPQVAIMGVGAIVKKPVVITQNGEDTIAIRSMMYLSHSYDHRIIDGFVGGMFVKRVAEILENFDLNRSL